MKRISTLFLLVFIVAFSQAQSPAGKAFNVDYDQFTMDNVRRYLNCGNDGSLNPGAEVTMEAWVRIHDSNWNQKIMGKLNPSFNSGYMLAVDQGKCYAEVWTPAHYDELQGFVPPLGFWYHFAATAKAGDSLKTYVNGEFVGGKPIGGSSIASNNDDFIVGIAPWDLQNFQYFGHLDEIRLWSTVRSEQEIQENMFIGIDGNQLGLIAYYDFNNAVITSPVTDNSQNSNDCGFVNCDASNITDSRAVIGDANIETMDDLHGLWNGNGFTNPRVSLTDNGLSLIDTLTEWDYVVFGHNSGNGISQSDLPASAPASMERTDRVWYLNEVGATSPNLSWNIDNAAGSGSSLNTGLNANQYYLLHRTNSTGNFSVAGSADVKNGSTVIFNNVDLETGYYALAASSDPLAIGAGFANNGLVSVYPNPGTGLYKMKVETQLFEATQLQVFNVLGKKVYAQQFDEDISFQVKELDLRNLAPGSYFLHIRSGNDAFVKEVIITGRD